MKIGVFGDSFADVFHHRMLGWPALVVKHFQAKAGYHATSGTSHWWAYQQFLAHHQEYDVILFAHTSPIRWSSLPPTESHRTQYNVGKRPGVSSTMDVLNEYFFDIFPESLCDFISASIFRNVNEICEKNHIYLVNVMCFEYQFHRQHPTRFPVLVNVNGVSGLEQVTTPRGTESIQTWLHGLYQRYPSTSQVFDVRECHLNDGNNAYLAEVVCDLIERRVEHTELPLLELSGWCVDGLTTHDFPVPEHENT